MKMLLTLIFFLSISLFGASFDCAKSTSKVEKMICADEKLAKLDSELSQIYAGFYFLSKEIKGDQREWMKQRNQCKNTVCIQKTYESRIADLNASLNNEKTFPKTYLEAMKLAQTTMDQINPKKVTSPHYYEKYDEKRNKAFQEDFFRFKNITVKTPLITEVTDYNVPKLKEILGECHGYRFDLRTDINPYHAIEDNEHIYYQPPDTREPVMDLNISIWKFSAQAKEWLLLQPMSWDSYYVIDPVFCKNLKFDGNLVEALNKNRAQIKKAYTTTYDNATLVDYKNKDYLITLYIDETSATFELIDILGLYSYYIPLEFIGVPYAGIKLKK